MTFKYELRHFRAIFRPRNALHTRPILKTEILSCSTDSECVNFFGFTRPAVPSKLGNEDIDLMTVPKLQTNVSKNIPNLLVGGVTRGFFEVLIFCANDESLVASQKGFLVGSINYDGSRFIFHQSGSS